MYSLLAPFQSVVIVGTFSPPDAIRTDTIPDIAIAANMEPKITFALGAAVLEPEGFDESGNWVDNGEVMVSDGACTFIKSLDPLR